MKNIILINFCIILLSCNASTKSLVNSNKNFTPKSDIDKENIALLQNRVTLVGQGNTPTIWTLQMSYDDTVRFVADDGLRLTVGYNQFKKTIKDNKTIYTTTIKESIITIVINDNACNINPQKSIDTKGITVQFNTNLYQGCARFLADANLDAKWILEKIGNENLDKNNYAKPPTFEINLSNNTATGNDGCNSFNTTIQVEGNRIRFYAFANTKKACTKNNIEKIIAKHINNHLVDYYLKDGKLYFYLEDDSLLVFKKF